MNRRRWTNAVYFGTIRVWFGSGAARAARFFVASSLCITGWLAPSRYKVSGVGRWTFALLLCQTTAINFLAGGCDEPEMVDDYDFDERRRQMVERQLRGRDITDARVLKAMQRVPRHEFVSPDRHDAAYADEPLPIGYGQTISQPYIVALMTQLAKPKADSRALDVGTGSGYQAAVLAEVCAEVYSIEIVEPLATEARNRLTELGYTNVEVRCGDGYRGWPEHAPFDVIIVAAAPDHVPQPLLDQLAVGGHLVIPVGKSYYQQLLVCEKQADGNVKHKTVAPVAFVPMTGEAETK